MRRTILAVLALVAFSAGCGDTEPTWLHGQPDADEATLDTSCPTLAAVTREFTFDPRKYRDRHVVCPPEAASWWTYDPEPRMHCEWRCVSYACAAGQDVRITYGADSHVHAIVSGPSAYCP